MEPRRERERGVNGDAPVQQPLRVDELEQTAAAHEGVVHGHAGAHQPRGGSEELLTHATDEGGEGDEQVGARVERRGHALVRGEAAHEPRELALRVLLLDAHAARGGGRLGLLLGPRLERRLPPRHLLLRPPLLLLCGVLHAG